jgi:hypothetical protein
MRDCVNQPTQSAGGRIPDPTEDSPKSRGGAMAERGGWRRESALKIGLSRSIQNPTTSSADARLLK